MQQLIFTEHVHAPATKVWEVLWEDTTYRQWTSAFQDGSYAVSDWKEGSSIHFLSPSGNGMYSIIERCAPSEQMFFKQLGEIKNFEEQPLDEKQKEWAGAMEKYYLQEKNSITELRVELETTGDFLSYFKNVFPKALGVVKAIAEGKINPAIMIETTITARMEKVWECWTRPAHIEQWNNASPDWHTPHSTNDLTPGGKFLYRMEAKDGSFGFDFEGTYVDIHPMKYIEYNIADGRSVKIYFFDKEKEIIVREAFEPETENSHELQRGGWQAILNNFKNYVEQNI